MLNFFEKPSIDRFNRTSNYTQMTESDVEPELIAQEIGMTRSKGNIEYIIETKYVEDGFKSESKIESKKDVIVDIIDGDVHLEINVDPILINETFGGSGFD